MTKPTVIVVTWQPVEGESLTVTVEVPTAFPDVVAEAAANARRLLNDCLGDVLDHYRKRAEIQRQSK